MSKRKCRTVGAWRQCDDPDRMLGWVWDRMSERKRRLFAEYNYDKLDDFGKVGLNLSARYFTFGLGFEF